MPVDRTLPQLPPPQTPLVGEDGRMTREWRLFFEQLMQVLELMRVEIP